MRGCAICIITVARCDRDDITRISALRKTDHASASRKLADERERAGSQAKGLHQNSAQTKRCTAVITSALGAPVLHRLEHLFHVMDPQRFFARGASCGLSAYSCRGRWDMTVSCGPALT
jgi:hypothetical protein